MRRGIGVSPGISVGTAYCIHEIYVNPETRRLEVNQVRDELARFDRAREATVADLRALQKKVSQQVGEREAAIFGVHEAILRDPAFTAKIRAWIADDLLTAPAAVQQLLSEYTALFSRTTDEYIRDRLADVRDVVIRLSEHLSDVLKPESPELPGPLIIIADELLPSHVVVLDKREMIGIVTQSGGQTSHAAILARSRGLPAVSGVSGILRQVKNGDTVVVDGREGVVLVNPAPETESAYRKLQREFFDLKDQLAANRHLPAVTRDGEPIQLLANINNLGDVKAAVAMGASGVGLYRTEYLFLTHPDVPDEQEQYEAYRDVIRACPDNRITIRTLDLGGDKTVPYFGHNREANPFMGWRSIRLSFEHPDFFAAQLRAILRAAAECDHPENVRVMFPMITTLEEMRRVRAMVHRIRRPLERRHVRAPRVPVGLMLEVPAAAVMIDALLEVVDFVSIGSNDLVQYLMAADRDNPKVTHLCQPLSPAVLRVLAKVIGTCNFAEKPVTLCGEMAGAPRAFVLLYAMGLRDFSMSPAFIPTVKELTSHLTRARADAVLDRALHIKTTAGVNRFMEAQIGEIAPHIQPLDTA
jgi:phosphotransferase system enzyme I (PtsI)